MSAFFVGVDHVNAMLTAAKDIDFYVARPGSEEWRPVAAHGKMSNGRYLPETVWTEIGRHLLEENCRSLAFRYPGDWTELLPDDWDLNAYRFAEDLYFLTRFKPTDALELVNCYEYQACEHTEWRHSWSREFCGRLVRALAAKVPSSRPGLPSLWPYDRPADAPQIVSLSSLIG